MHPDLKSIVDPLLHLAGIQTKIITNGYKLPSGRYDEFFIKKYLRHHFGEETIPQSLQLILSLDPDHETAFMLKKDKTDESSRRRIYLERVKNLMNFTIKNKLSERVRINSVTPRADTDPEQYERLIRTRYQIPAEINIGVIPLSSYTPEQKLLQNAKTLRYELSPKSSDTTLFARLLKPATWHIYRSLTDLGFNQNSLTLEDFAQQQLRYQLYNPEI
ncbi:MAG: hypothetical protein WCJ58_03315 [bacterium]